MENKTGDKTPKLIFVYNADSGFLNALGDFAHKIVRPSTYACNLCAVTFGNLGMKMEWKQFVNNLDLDVEFLHKDEFREKYKKDGEFPSVYIKNTDFKVFISQTEMNAIKNQHELMDLVKDKLAQHRA
jgi:hypothetical protein